MSDSPDHSARRDAYKKEGIAWCLSLIAAIATFIGLAFLVDRTYHPDTASAIERASELSIIHSSAFHPEPKEKALFLLGVVTIPLAFTGFYLLFRKVLTTFSSVTLRRLFAPILIVSLLTVVVAGYAGLMAANPFHLDAPNSHDEVALSNLQFYFIDTFLYVHPALYTFLFFPLAALLLWYREPLWQRLPPLAERVAGWLCYGWCGGLVVLVLTIHVFRFPYTYPNKYDFSAVYYSMVQVFGGAPLLVDGFTNTYGLYPHFLVPIFKLTGLSVLTFSGVMAVLDAICFGLLFLTLRRQLR
ncbi:MAG TPA: hypothetical protein VI389_03580, partial [Geobacteraceae bacterium]